MVSADTWRDAINWLRSERDAAEDLFEDLPWWRFRRRRRARVIGIILASAANQMANLEAVSRRGKGSTK